MPACFLIHQFLDRHVMTGIDANLIACLELRAYKIGRPRQNQRLPAHLLFKPQSSVRHGLCQFQDRAVTVITQRFDHCVGLVDQNLRSNLKIRIGNAGVHVGIILGPTDDDAGESLAGNIK